MTEALIVIDVQESFRVRESWADISDPDIATPVGTLVDHARARGDLVVWVLHSEPGTGGAFDPVNGHVRLIDGLVPAAGEPTLTKTAHNAFTTTDLQRMLTVRGVRGLRVCGIRTEQCCETTARVASDLGYDVTFVTDATATSPITHWRTGAVLSTPEIIERTEYALAGRFATVATVAEVTGLR
ncbi:MULTISPECIES: cysteine hydrolase family protein [Actinokineospora]|uniref:Hydrolase n=1 Tax=Actinokineospora fastidiosa TaxID=1816 RepID=A0A918LC92_9PSEU|nr:MULTISPECIES: isochorismatase family protein [Actinokineospora]UVS79683.1 Peroxyureidoacrylate/ureidoacrylate amidohydrolase RutB [Actinokineospora sp. UTMC 2448]GGS30265.1 hydrolase [Actinokineospora fastidiosa]